MGSQGEYNRRAFTKQIEFMSSREELMPWFSKTHTARRREVRDESVVLYEDLLQCSTSLLDSDFSRTDSSLESLHQRVSAVSDIDIASYLKGFVKDDLELRQDTNISVCENYVICTVSALQKAGFEASRTLLTSYAYGSSALPLLMPHTPREKLSRRHDWATFQRQFAMALDSVLVQEVQSGGDGDQETRVVDTSSVIEDEKTVSGGVDDDSSSGDIDEGDAADGARGSDDNKGTVLVSDEELEPNYCFRLTHILFAEELATYAANKVDNNIPQLLLSYFRSLVQVFIDGINENDAAFTVWLRDDKAGRDRAVERLESLSYVGDYDLRWRMAKRLEPNEEITEDMDAFRAFQLLHERMVREHLSMVDMEMSRLQHFLQSRYFHELSSTGNSIYIPVENVIVIPVGSLQPEFVHSNVSFEYLMASFVWVMAHELGHALSSPMVEPVVSRKYEVEPETIERFEAVSARVMGHFKKLNQWQHGRMATGRIGKWNSHKSIGTFSENFSDIVAMRAIELLFSKKKPILQEAGLVGEKEVKMETIYEILAQINCEGWAKQASGIIKDPKHAPAWLRVNGPLAYSTTFAETFQCPEESRFSRIRQGDIV